MAKQKGSILAITVGFTLVFTMLGSASIYMAGLQSEAQEKQILSQQAFWIAEAGLAEKYYDWAHNGVLPVTGTYSFNGKTYTVNADSFPEVSVTGQCVNVNRTIQALFVGIPYPFDNTLSSGGDITLNGFIAGLNVHDKTRISGQYKPKAFGAYANFDDKKEGESQNFTTIKIPDYNNNGTLNEFGDFVLFGQKAVASYPADQVVYLPTDGTVNIFPNQNLVGKKVIFVQGTQPGKGNVNINYDATWQPNQDLTVISTGSINYLEPLQFQTNSRLSTISWGNYNEGSIFRSQHESVIYTNQNANFTDILEWGSTTGNVIANGNITFNEYITYQDFYFSDRAKNGDLPPGFEWLCGTTGIPYLMNWQEVD